MRGEFERARAFGMGGMGERKFAVIAAWAQGDSVVPSLNVEGMIEECGAVVKLEVFMGKDFRVRSN